MKFGWIFSVLLILFSCQREISEDPISYTIFPEPPDGKIIITSDTLKLSIKLHSVLPKDGIRIDLKMIQNDDGALISQDEYFFRVDTFNIRVFPFVIGKIYNIEIKVTSVKNIANTNSTGITVQRNRVYKNYLKPSYDLSNFESWFSSTMLYNIDGSKYLHNPLNDMQHCQLDIDGDGREDLFYYEGYDLNINPMPNPPPSVFMNNGVNLKMTAWNGPAIKYPHGCKLLVGDFNNDSLPDIFSLVAIDPPNVIGFPLLQDNCHLIFNSPSGFNSVKEFDDKKGFWYSGCSGDIDNDGDLDIIMFNFHYLANGVESVILWNDGKGNFTYDPNGIGKIPTVEDSELVDINTDGYLDLVVDYVTSTPGRQPNVAILWGDGHNFTLNNSTRFNYPGTKFMMDLDFADIDQDKIKEIFISGSPFPDYYIDVFKSYDQGATFRDVTSTCFDDNHCTRFGHMRIRDLDNDGKPDIYASDRKDNIRWEWNGSKFIKQ